MKTTGLTIQEAIKSGKPYKRKGHEHLLDPKYDGYLFNQDDLLATDWEIEQEPTILYVPYFDHRTGSDAYGAPYLSKQECLYQYPKAQIRKFVEVIE